MSVHKLRAFALLGAVMMILACTPAEREDARRVIQGARDVLCAASASPSASVAPSSSSAPRK